MPDNHYRDRTAHLVAPVVAAGEEAAAGTVATADGARGFWGEAWHQLIRRPMFYLASILILGTIVVALFPGLFASEDPRYGDLSRSLKPAEPGHPFGFSEQGYDIFARTIHGASASVVTGLGTTVLVTLIGVIVGALAGFYGGWWDTLLSRVTDIFFAIPLMLAAIVVMQLFTARTVWTVIVVLAAFGWPQMARVVRGAVMEAKENDYVDASTALGLSRLRILMRHVLPNSLAPIIVMATMSLGVYIVAEASLSYLGIGLPPSTVSWGNDIAAAQTTLRRGSTILFYPAAALAISVLGFILMGDVLKDALDPKARKR